MFGVMTTRELYLNSLCRFRK